MLLVNQLMVSSSVSQPGRRDREANKIAIRFPRVLYLNDHAGERENPDGAGV